MAHARTVALLLLVALVLGACSAGAPAPSVGNSEEVCNTDFCVGYPVGWDVVEVGDQFISFMHPSTDGVVATVGRVNMEGVVLNAGGQWPQSARNVVDHLWSLLDGGGAELTRVDLATGGALDSRGSVSTGRLWHRLVPVTSSVAIGVEVRAPNLSWEPHADVFRQSVQVLNSEL